MNRFILILAGLMVTSAILYHFLNFFHVTIDIRNVCVFLAPLFSSLTTLVTYHLTKELKVCSSTVYSWPVIFAFHLSYYCLSTPLSHFFFQHISLKHLNDMIFLYFILRNVPCHIKIKFAI